MFSFRRRQQHRAMVHPATALVVIFLALHKVALSWAAESTAEAATAPTPAPAATLIRDPKVSDLFVPKELGYVVETHPAARPTERATIIHIQEAHANYEGQQHLVGILEHLVATRGLRLILVEGGEGDGSLAYLRAYGSPERRRAVAQKYLRAGILTAEEYLDIASDAPLILWGVDDRQLYRAHLRAFLKADEARQSLAPKVAALAQAAEALRPHTMPPVLLELERRARAFERQELSLGDYAGFLAQAMQDQRIASEDYPHLARFLQAKQHEAAADSRRVAQEQRQLLAVLLERLPAGEAPALVQQARDVAAGRGTPAEYFGRLKRAAGQAGIGLSSFPHFSTYLLALEDAAAVQPLVLAQELESLASRLRERLTRQSADGALAQAMEGVALLEKLVGLRLSPTEYARWQQLRRPDVVADWATQLNQALRQYRPTSAAIQDVHIVATALPTFEAFYQAAVARDEALVRRTLAKLSETGERLAVLITGGFHSPHVTRALVAQGAEVVVVAPKVSRPTDEAHYRAVVKYKIGLGSLEEVFATAGMPEAEVP